MRKPSFSVVTAVVTILCLLGFSARVLEPLIPDPEPNPISRQPGDFMKQAFKHRIAWQVVGETAFADARRLDRPVLLVIGHSWSATGRYMDEEIFTATDIANFLNTNFIPVRIDGGVLPAWTNAYLPLSRVGTGIQPDFQMWVLSPTGALLDPLYRPRASQVWNRNRFLDALMAAKDVYERSRETQSDTPAAIRQAQDIAELRTADSSAVPDLGASLQQIIAGIHPEHGGFPFNGYQNLRPNAWRLLAVMGATDAMRSSLRPALLSPLMDIQDGGFFVRARQDKWRTIEFDKPAELNAQMMLTLILASHATPDPDLARLCKWAAVNTLESLDSEFKTQAGLVFAARRGDEEAEMNRSERSSYSPRRLRRAIKDDWIRSWAFDNLGLRVQTNPQMVPMLANEKVLEDPLFAEALSGLRGDYTVRQRFTGGITMNVSATVAARQMQVARILGDDEALRRGAEMLDWIETFRVADQVPHDLAGGHTQQEFLGDYLAYADAALQDYLANGRVVSLFRGASVLSRALLVFHGDSPGQLRQTRPTGSQLVPDAPAIPEIVDNFGESTSAAAIRLCNGYGRLLLDPEDESERGLRFLRMAQAITAAFADTAPGLGPSAAAYLCSAAEVVDDRFALAVGPRAQELADELYRLRPTRLVAPRFGSVRTEIQDAEPGLYVFERGVPIGPLTVEEAADRLPFTFGAAVPGLN